MIEDYLILIEMCSVNLICVVVVARLALAQKRAAAATRDVAKVEIKGSVACATSVYWGVRTIIQDITAKYLQSFLAFYRLEESWTG